MTALELLVCSFLIAISAFMAASEVALFSLSRFQLRSLKERMKGPYKRIKRLLADPGGLLVTILVVNEVVNISLSSIIVQMVSRIFEGPSSLGTGHPLPAWFFQTLVNVILTAPIVLFLCDISPKIIGAKANQLVAPLLVGPLTFVYVGLKPLRLSLRRVAWAFSRAPKTEADGEKAGGENKLLKESDFIHLVEEGHKEGSIQEKELELIKNVFRLEEMELQELLTPLSGMRCMTEDTSLRNALSALRGATYARIPIMNASRNRVLGILHSKDLLRAQLEPQLLSNRVSTLMRKPLFVKSTLHLNSLFRKFKQQRTHMAVVRNEAGVSIGVITMSDILETLFENHLLDDSEYGGSSLHHPSYLTKSKTRAD